MRARTFVAAFNSRVLFFRCLDQRARTAFRASSLFSSGDIFEKRAFPPFSPPKRPAPFIGRYPAVTRSAARFPVRRAANLHAAGLCAADCVSQVSKVVSPSRALLPGTRVLSLSFAPA
jgi:hypothetical protein